VGVAGIPVRLRRWAATVAATVVSVYALDAVATACGIALAASHLLGGLDQPQLLVFLVATYVLWALGLRANLAANWGLLEATGTSTNVLSKAAYDVTSRALPGVRARRRASAAGYVATEAAKEIPYYAGAIGVAILSDSVGSSEVLIFLAGTNLGAAAYEYGLARLTRAFLRLRAAPPVEPSTTRS
jgi:hypothetical protein